MRLRTALVVASLAAFAFALSQPPSPRLARQGAQQQQSASQVDQQTPLQSGQPSSGQASQQEQSASDYDLLDWFPDLIVGLLTIGIGYLQWQVMQGQKTVSENQAEIAERQNTIIATQTSHMESGLAVARDSANAAVKAANAAEIQASFTVAQKRVSDQQLAQMEAGLEVAKINADAAKMSAGVAAMALEHADRPWIRVYLEPESLTVSDGEFLEIKCRVTVKNIGKSVAQQVMIWDQLAIHPNALQAEQEKLRAHFDQPRLVSTIGGFTLFPDEEKTQVHSVGTGKEAPDRYWREMMPDMLKRDLGDRILPLTYIGCVGYRYGTSDKWHYTYWGYDLVTADGRHLPLHIAAGKLPQPPYFREGFMGNLNRAT